MRVMIRQKARTFNIPFLFLFLLLALYWTLSSVSESLWHRLCDSRITVLLGLSPCLSEHVSAVCPSCSANRRRVGLTDCCWAVTSSSGSETSSLGWGRPRLGGVTVVEDTSWESSAGTSSKGKSSGLGLWEDNQGEPLCYLYDSICDICLQVIYLTLTFVHYFNPLLSFSRQGEMSQFVHIGLGTVQNNSYSGPNCDRDKYSHIEDRCIPQNLSLKS